jgi:hypothetical protein
MGKRVTTWLDDTSGEQRDEITAYWPQGTLQPSHPLAPGQAVAEDLLAPVASGRDGEVLNPKGIVG